jgi:hypothetical protein
VNLHVTLLNVYSSGFFKGKNVKLNEVAGCILKSPLPQLQMVVTCSETYLVQIRIAKASVLFGIGDFFTKSHNCTIARGLSQEILAAMGWTIAFSVFGSILAISPNRLHLQVDCM